MNPDRRIYSITAVAAFVAVTAISFIVPRDPLAGVNVVPATTPAQAQAASAPPARTTAAL